MKNKKDLFCIKDLVVVITGGYGILGSSITTYFATHGAKVVVIGRRQEKGDSFVEPLQEKGMDVCFYCADVLDKEQLIKTRALILEKYKRIDLLINAAGGNLPGATISPDKTILDLKLEDFREVVDLNLMGTVLPSVVFAEAMIESGRGNIINISSESALRPLTRVVGYGVAKAAVTNFTQYLAGELALKYGDTFRVNAIAPGFFITDQNRTLLTNPDGTYTDRAKSILAHTPFKRFGEPDEILGALHYLASDASKFVTGSLLTIDGGFDSFSI